MKMLFLISHRSSENLPVSRTYKYYQERVLYFPNLARCIALLLSAALFLNIMVGGAGAEPSFAGFALGRNSYLRGVSIPLGRAANAAPLLYCHFGEIGVEARKLGFLRIGPVPQIVAENLRIDLLGNIRRQTWACEIGRFVESQVGWRNLRIRGLQIHGRGNLPKVVEADEATIDLAGNCLRLRKGKITAYGGCQGRFENAEISFSGPQADLLIWNEGHVRHVFSFAAQQKEKIQPAHRFLQPPVEMVRPTLRSEPEQSENNII